VSAKRMDDVPTHEARAAGDEDQRGAFSKFCQ
jgi:hypothetical protein